MKKFYDIEIDSQIELENGKTLGKLEESKISVNDGNCGSGGGGTMIVNVTIDENSGGYVADKTYDEIMDAIETGVVVKCIIYYEDEGRNFVLDLHSYDIRY